MGKEATVFYHRQADLLASKHGWTHSTTLSWVHCVLAFSLLSPPLCAAYSAAGPSLSGALLLQLRWTWP